MGASTLCLLLSAVLFTFSAICLQFQLFVYFLSAEISCLFTSCQLIFEFLCKNHVFWVTFLPLQMLQHFNCKFKKKIIIIIISIFCPFSTFPTFEGTFLHFFS